VADHHPHGLFSWADLSTPDPEAATSFYTGVFGWEAEDATEDDGTYVSTLLRKDGKLVAGLGPLPQAPQDRGAPPSWNSYINVDDVDAVVATVAAAGGTVLATRDVMEGRMAFLQDPAGAVVGLWQPGTHEGAELFGEPGAMTWNELATRDSEGAREFYGRILPWDFEPFPGGNEYYVIQLGERQNGGILTMDDNWPAHIPAHWMVYFSVADTDETVARAAAGGGSVVNGPFSTPVGKVAVIADPHGAVFSVIAPAPASQET
jgi:predicted enzyme related to lactoylglutathione lyase